MPASTHNLETLMVLTIVIASINSSNASEDMVTVQAMDISPPSSFVQTQGHHFVVDGKPLYVNGVNLYYLMTQGAIPEFRPLVTEVLEASAGVGATVVRAWAFADGSGQNCLQTQPGVYSEAVFQGLDFAVAEARKNGMRVILSFVNNWDDFGGRAQYAAWARELAGNVDADADDFYTDGTMRQWYQNHIKAVVTRENTFTGVAYRDEPAVFAWELINEPHCESDASGYVLQEWIREMASYVKSLDANHLLEVGLEGFYSSSVVPNSVGESANPAAYTARYGTDFILNSQPSGIDFTTVHSYPDNWITDQTEEGKRAFMYAWIQTHIDDAEYKLGKPVLFTEFGRSDRTPGYTESVRLTAMTDVFDAIYASAQVGGPAGGVLVWHFVPKALEASLQDGYAVVVGEAPAVADLMRMQTDRLMSIMPPPLR